MTAGSEDATCSTSRSLEAIGRDAEQRSDSAIEVAMGQPSCVGEKTGRQPPVLRRLQKPQRSDDSRQLSTPTDR